MITAAPEDQRLLLQLQQLDTRLDQILHRRDSLPELTGLAGVEARLADVAAALVTSRTAAADLRRELTKAEADVEQVRNRSTRDQARLDSGSATTKDVQALSSEMDQLARRQAALEEVELGVMERLESHEAALAEIESAHAVLVGQRVEAQAALDAARAVLDAEAADVRARRDALAAPLDPGLLALYERLRRRLGGVAVAALRHGVSEGSGLPLPPSEISRVKAMPAEELLFCEDSGRILVRGEDAF